MNGFVQTLGLSRSGRILADVAHPPVDNPSRPPSVDRLARSLTGTGLPHPLLVQIARRAIAEGDPGSAPELARRRARQMLVPVINATGVLLHTNLGRAPIAHHQEATYANLELDLSNGKRGGRQEAVGTLVATAVGADDAIIVNNCAAAVLLILAALGRDRCVAVSRGELVEIGGGFRVPDVMTQSGATLVEVGTTNRTRLADFQRAAADHDLALAMHIHQSNYRIVGFTESVSIADLSSLDVPVVADIGSGLLDASCPWLDGPPPDWLRDEPAARQTLEAGAALVCFSGDKLLGGPQAGIIAGRADLVRTCARHPLARALRPGGLVLSALQATLEAYLRRDGDAIPFWRMAARSTGELRDRADDLARRTDHEVTVIDTRAVPGGGTLPDVSFPSIGVRLVGDHVEALREHGRPIIARIENQHTVLDLRTIDPDDDEIVVEALDGLTTSTSSP